MVKFIAGEKINECEAVYVGKDGKLYKVKNVLFHEREALADKAEKWCIDNGFPITPINIITALYSISHIFCNHE